LILCKTVTKIDIGGVSWGFSFYLYLAQTGTANLTRYLGSASTSGKTDSGGAGGSRAEFILQQNQAIMVDLVSRADNNALTIEMDWYEHTNKTNVV